MQPSPLTDSTKARGFYPALCCLISCLCALYLAQLSVYPLLETFAACVLAVFVCVYSTLFTIGTPAFRLLPPLVGAVAIAARHLFSHDVPALRTGLNFVNIIAAVLCALVFVRCARMKARKSVTFAALSAAYTVFFFVLAAFMATKHYGVFDLSVPERAATDLSDAAGRLYASLLGSALRASGEQSADLADLLMKAEETIALSVKISLPSIVISYCMLIAAVTLALYKPFVKLAHAEETCLEGRVWSFSLSGVSIAVFYLSYAVYFISGLFSGQSALAAAFMNVAAILSYPFAVIGVKFLCGALCAKVKNRAGGIVLLSVILIFSAGLAGPGLLVTLLAFIGASAQLSLILRTARKP